MSNASDLLRIVLFENEFYAAAPPKGSDPWLDDVELHHLPLSYEVPLPPRRVPLSIFGALLVAGDAVFVDRGELMAAARREGRKLAKMKAFIAMLASYQPKAPAERVPATPTGEPQSAAGSII